MEAALSKPNAPIERVVAIVGQEVAVSAKLLQPVNPSFFALARDGADLQDRGELPAYVGVP